MSVGGEVVRLEETYFFEMKQHLVQVVVQDTTYQGTFTSVLTRPAIHLPEFGDIIWWQSGTIYWSRHGSFTDKKLPKISNSSTYEGMRKPIYIGKDRFIRKSEDGQRDHLRYLLRYCTVNDMISDDLPWAYTQVVNTLKKRKMFL